MRVLVTGAAGMLAHALLPALAARGHEVLPVTRAELDVTDAEAVSSLLTRERPEAVVQCAAYTAVDAAEGDEAGAHAVNATATAHLARACQEIGALLVYPSTDYVFDGRGRRPYRPDDPTAPVNAYGRSKRAGELAALRAGEALVVRTSWLYGAGGGNFVDTIARLAAERDRLEVVDDQVGRPTATDTLATVLAELMDRGGRGIFHATDAGEPVSWHGFAARILAFRGLETELAPVPTSRFPRPAPRPAYSVLDCTATEAMLGRPLPPWEGVLEDYLGARRRG